MISTSKVHKHGALQDYMNMFLCATFVEMLRGDPGFSKRRFTKKGEHIVGPG